MPKTLKRYVPSFETVNAYILDSIDNSGYSDTPLETDTEKLQFVRDTFLSEYGWNVQQVGELEALAGWLSGLPSSINIEFRNHAIIQLGEKFGLLPLGASDRQIDAFLEKWFKFMAMRIRGLWFRHGITTIA